MNSFPRCYKLLPDFSVEPLQDLAGASFDHNSLLKTKIGKIEVSTIFLVIDHNWGYSDGDPVLFETMVFTQDSCGSGFEGTQQRYSTYEKAKAGHEALVRKIRARMRP